MKRKLFKGAALMALIFGATTIMAACNQPSQTTPAEKVVWTGIADLDLDMGDPAPNLLLGVTAKQGDKTLTVKIDNERSDEVDTSVAGAFSIYYVAYDGETPVKEELDGEKVRTINVVRGTYVDNADFKKADKKGWGGNGNGNSKMTWDIDTTKEALVVNIEKSGDEYWQNQVEFNGLTVKKDTTYVINIKAKSDTPRNIGASLEVPALGYRCIDTVSVIEDISTYFAMRGRAIVRDAKIFLMDEPLSNLDAKLRVKMRSEIIKLHQLLQTTSIYVTHDQVEAMTMATRIVVMSKGFVQQIGTPEEIYAHPANKFVASFIGTPAMNIYQGHYDIKTGMLDLGNFKEFKLPKEQQETIKKFLADQIDMLNKRIENIDYEVQLAPHQMTKEEKEAIKNSEKTKENAENAPEYMTDFESSVKAHQIVSNAVLKGSNKFSLKTMFKKNKLPTYDEVKEKLLDEIRGLIEKYTECQQNGFDIDIGIRPDDILYAENKDRVAHPGPAIKLVSTVSELLGNEYYIHNDYQGIDLICKAVANKRVHSGDELEFVFDMDKIHLFDKLSEKAIF